ncbi:hypothetical protein DFH08DRAFT_821853 [Mycena albidolilacea]|uniref:Uncharacterized protein n=1 Tax=Mycena albidolilacea TaxID=1033008 RepID=A0AAD7ECS8_9AGAR|nr:hypothetical protein DFH08DRAFT_821853 [Mycena albidolilacea]
MVALVHHENLSNVRKGCLESSVRSVLMQILAIQQELGEPLNLNRDLLGDLVTGRVILCLSDGPKALETMFAAIALSGSEMSVESGAVVQQMLGFNNAHAFYDSDFRSPTFRREGPSTLTPATPILVVLKRKGEAKIDGEKQAKRENTSKNGMKAETTVSQIIEMTYLSKANLSLMVQKWPAPSMTATGLIDLNCSRGREESTEGQRRAASSTAPHQSVGPSAEFNSPWRSTGSC